MPDVSPGTDPAEERLTELFTTHHRRVVAYVARRTRPLGDLSVAQDVASDVFALAWQRLSDGRGSAGGTPLGLPWLLATAGNVHSQRTRDDARRTAREERAMTDRAITPRSSTSTDPADVLALSEQVARVLDRMAPADRELLLLRVWDELSFAEAAQVLGCSPGAARVRWLRARRRFADLLTRDAPDDQAFDSGRVAPDPPAGAPDPDRLDPDRLDPDRLDPDRLDPDRLEGDRLRPDLAPLPLDVASNGDPR